MNENEKLSALSDDVLAQAIFDAMKAASPKAMFWLEDAGPDDDVLIDGHFTFRKVAECLRDKLGRLEKPD